MKRIAIIVAVLFGITPALAQQQPPAPPQSLDQRIAAELGALMFKNIVIGYQLEQAQAHAARPQPAPQAVPPAAPDK